MLPFYFQHKFRYEKCRWNNGFSFSFSYFPTPLPHHSLIHWWPKTPSSSPVFVTRRLPRFPPNDRNFGALHNELPKEFPPPPAIRDQQVQFFPSPVTPTTRPLNRAQNKASDIEWKWECNHPRTRLNEHNGELVNSFYGGKFQNVECIWPEKRIFALETSTAGGDEPSNLKFFSVSFKVKILNHLNCRKSGK